MKRLLTAAFVAALMLVPASALARHGNHGNHKLHRSHGTVGTVTAYDAATGDLTLTTKKGRAVSALVTDATRLRCAEDATASDHGNDDGDDDAANHDANDDHADDDAANHDANDDDSATACVPAVGDTVRRARIDLDGDDAVWTKLVLS